MKMTAVNISLRLILVFAFCISFFAVFHQYMVKKLGERLVVTSDCNFNASTKAPASDSKVDLNDEDVDGEVEAPSPVSPVFKRYGNRRFDMYQAAKLWDKKVGCDKFREKHQDLIEMYSKGGSVTWPPNPSFQNLSKLSCRDMQLHHVSIWVKHRRFMTPFWLEGIRFCSRCGLSCEFTWNRNMAENVDVEFFVYSEPNRKRAEAEPLVAKYLIEPIDWSKTRTNFDISISYESSYDLQSTYARTKERQHYLAKKKLQDVLVYRASSNCKVKNRNNLLKNILKHLPHHSFGKCDNNVGGLNKELIYYPICAQGLNIKDVNISKHGWPRFANCIMSQYKFVLAIEKAELSGYVSEKLFMPLESNSVPIYFGAPDVENFMPPHSFIHIRDFNSSKVLVDYVWKVHNDPVLYMDYFAWKRCGVLGHYIRSRELSMDTLPCRLCELASVKGGRNAPVA